MERREARRQRQRRRPRLWEGPRRRACGPVSSPSSTVIAPRACTLLAPCRGSAEVSDPRAAAPPARPPGRGHELDLTAGRRCCPTLGAWPYLNLNRGLGRPGLDRAGQEAVAMTDLVLWAAPGLYSMHLAQRRQQLCAGPGPQARVGRWGGRGPHPPRAPTGRAGASGPAAPCKRLAGIKPRRGAARATESQRQSPRTHLLLHQHQHLHQQPWPPTK